MTSYPRQRLDQVAREVASGASTAVLDEELPGLGDEVEHQLGKALTAALAKYSADQPRDADGRFGSGGAFAEGDHVTVAGRYGDQHLRVTGRTDDGKLTARPVPDSYPRDPDTVVDPKDARAYEAHQVTFRPDKTEPVPDHPVSMSAKDANELARSYNGSEYIGSMFHGTTPEAAAGIRSEGFRTDTEVAHGRMYGNGIYLASHPTGYGNANVEVQVLSQNPVTIDMGSQHDADGFIDQLAHETGGSVGRYNALYNAASDAADKLPGAMAPFDPVRQFMNETGHDSIHLTTYKGERMTIVFDPKRVVVVQ